MAKPKKTPRPKAQTPKGFRDYFGAEVSHRAEMLRKISDVYQRYGFDALESSAVETVEALGKFLPDVDHIAPSFKISAICIRTDEAPMSMTATSFGPVTASASLG